MKSNPLKLRKGAWAPEEDSLLRKCIEKYGEGKWHQVPQRAGLNRCRKSCRLRWLNYLRPSIKRGEFAEDEVDLIMRLHNLLGNRWSLIAGRLPGRTANDVKNYWNTNLQKKSCASASSCRKEVAEINDLTVQNIGEDRVLIKPLPRTLSKGTCVRCYSSPNNHSSLHISPNSAGDNNNTYNYTDMLVDNKPLSPSADQDDTEWWAKLLDQIRVSTGEEDSSADLLILSSGGSDNINMDPGTGLPSTTDNLSPTATKFTSPAVSEADGQNGWADIWDFFNADH